MPLLKRYYQTHENKLQLVPNIWDIIALIIISACIILLIWAALQMVAPYEVGQSIDIDLDPSNLPRYALRTISRIFIALCISLLFTFTVGTLAAKNAQAERILIPMIDILQSVPVLSFLAITVVGFIRLFPGSLLGPECASIFAIFTAQAWNMTLGFYQTLKNIPADLKEVAHMFHLSKWQQFWRIEVPCSMSSLLWNMMMSTSASWFFVVASEAIYVSNQQIRLPGIGSYIALAIEHSDMLSVCYAIIVMFFLILIYDQLIFRPLLQWSEQFYLDTFFSEANTRSWTMHLLNKTRFLKYTKHLFELFTDRFVNFFRYEENQFSLFEKTEKLKRLGQWLSYSFILALSLGSLIIFLYYIYTAISLSEILRVTWLGFITTLRVMVLIVLCSLIWVPVGVYIGMRPRTAKLVQPLIQILAAFPANLLFPLVVIFILHYHLNIEIWTTPLMILGSQWYILFNIIAGVSTIPKDLYHVTNNLGVSKWLWWRRFMLPGIFPYFITGAMTAAGGAWNASIVAEWVTWGQNTITATGIGAYITHSTKVGDFHRIALGTAMMCFYVLLLNRLIWRPLYKFAEERYQLV